MKQREHPCLCVYCKCGSIIMASALKAQWIKNDETLLNELEEFAKEGYEIKCLDASEFKIQECNC